ncbi:hypothetical protein BH11PLA2_BH11PLA2_21410 [soil metagenome]
MTSLGKLLVLVNTFVAVILFGWAVSLYTNRVDWFDRTTEDGKIEGQITQLQAEVKRYSDMIKGTQVAYANAAKLTAETEQTRDFRNYKLNQRLDNIRRVDDQVKFLEQRRIERSALIDVGNDGPVINGLNGQPLKGLGFLRKKYDDLTRESMAKQSAILKYRAEYEALCVQVDTIQDEVLRQKVIFNNLKDEQEYLADARINWEEQLRTLEIRKTQLQQRLVSFGK